MKFEFWEEHFTQQLTGFLLLGGGNVKIIDIHIPVFSDEIAPSTIKYLEEKANTKAYLNGTISDLKTSMKRAKISISVNQPISTKPSQVHSINNWIKQTEKWIYITNLRDAEVSLYQKLLISLSKGKASSIAIAKVRNWGFPTADRKARFIAQEQGIKLSGTLEILKSAVIQQVLTVVESDKLLSEMIKRGYHSLTQALIN